MEAGRSNWFQRFLLPGFAFKAVVIGGGYATGRELAEFFLPAGPWGGLAALGLATAIWSVVCAFTFVLAKHYGAYDYRSFFECLLGPGWIAFEIAYLAFVVLILSVFGAAAGAIGQAVFGCSPTLGTICLAGAIAGVATFGNASVERLFKYVSFLLYGVYALFVLLALTRFGADINGNFTRSGIPAGGAWAAGSLPYASYNVVGAVIVLPVVRHMKSERDAAVAGLVAGPLAMLPAMLFFICMIAFYPGIARETLPSDYMLRQLDMPLFHLLFQLMIFAALLESGTGAVHAVNERISAAWQRRHGTGLSHRMRGLIASALLVICIWGAARVGLVTLIGRGYRFIAYVLLAVYVLPVLAVGIGRMTHLRRRLAAPPPR